MAQEQIRIGLIGCGGNMRGHVKNRLASIPEARVVAMAEPSADQVAAMVKAVPAMADVSWGALTAPTGRIWKRL